MNRKEFTKFISLRCQLATIGTGIFPSVAIAQATLESGNGMSNFAQKQNNLFGIKCHGFKTCENGFRKYENWYQSILDYTKFLKSNKRYSKALKASTPEKQIIEISKAGYAKENYHQLLLKIHKDNNLSQYDNRTKIYLYFVLLIMLVRYLTKKVRI